MLNPWQCVSAASETSISPHWSTPAVPWLSLESVQSLTFGAPAQSTFGPLQSWFPLSPPAARELSQSDTPLRVRLELRSLVSDPRGRARPEDHAPDTPLGPTKNTPSSTCSDLAPPPLPVNHCPDWRTRPLPNTPLCRVLPPAPANQSPSLSGRSQLPVNPQTRKAHNFKALAGSFHQKDPSTLTAERSRILERVAGEGSLRQREMVESLNFINHENSISRV